MLISAGCYSGSSRHRGYPGASPPQAAFDLPKGGYAGRACAKQWRSGPAGKAAQQQWGMVLTKVVSLAFLTSAAVIFFNVLTGKHQQLADEVSSVLHQSFARSTFEVHDPTVLEVRHEVSAGEPTCQGSPE